MFLGIFLLVEVPLYSYEENFQSPWSSGHLLGMWNKVQLHQQNVTIQQKPPNKSHRIKCRNSDVKTCVFHYKTLNTNFCFCCFKCLTGNIIYKTLNTNFCFCCSKCLTGNIIYKTLNTNFSFCCSKCLTGNTIYKTLNTNFCFFCCNCLTGNIIYRQTLKPTIFKHFLF